MTRRLFLASPLALYAAPGLDLSGYQETLTKYVTPEGKVNYAGIHADFAGLDAFVKAIASFDANSLQTREDKLAHWINVYNALVLWSFAAEYPKDKNRLKNPLSRANYFFRRKFNVCGRQRSLDDIESNSLRKELKEPRIHFAIVCASTSCPALSRTAYTAANVMAQLEADALRFAAQDKNVRADVATKTLTVSEIFKWFQADFGGSEAAVIAFLSRYKKNARINDPGWKLKYFNYDWSINERAEPQG
jgi:hypothetical protein